MSAPAIPSTARKVVVHTLSNDFRAATKIDTFDIPQLQPQQVLIRNAFTGINASDINFTAGKYTPGAQPPLDAGFESIGEVVQIGSEVKNFKVGDAAVGFGFGAFSEYKVVEAARAIPMPSVEAKFIPLIISGLTASISLEQVGEMKQVGVDGAKQETVVVTAAAGGTGVFAVQLAKLAGHHVVATCSSDDKVAFLKGLGADRVINYKTENFGEVLKKEYPTGVNLVYESVGGSMFNDCVANLAKRGRIIVIGAISGYQNGSAFKASADDASARPLPLQLIGKSASVRGFLLLDFAEHIGRHLQQLAKYLGEGKIQSIVDPKPFVGLESIADALDHLFKGGNVGKIVVDIRQK